MQSTIDLTPSMEKIGRAKFKLHNLAATINDYIASKPVSVRQVSHSGFNHLISSVDKAAPSSVSWEVVEIVGHLRAALDKAIVAIVAHNRRGVSGVGYPFGGLDNGKVEEFPNRRMEQSLKKKLTLEQWDHIIRQRPYPTGNDLLWSVNEIANEDKHRINLVKTKAVGSLATLDISGGKIGKISSGTDEFDFILQDRERETVLISSSSTPGQPQIKCGVSVLVVFGDIYPVAGRDVLEILDGQVTMIEKIVREMSVLV